MPVTLKAKVASHAGISVPQPGKNPTGEAFFTRQTGELLPDMRFFYPTGTLKGSESRPFSVLTAESFIAKENENRAAVALVGYIACA